MYHFSFYYKVVYNMLYKMQRKRVCVWLLVLFFVICTCLSHPQCLDYQPPFEATEVEFCSTYRNYGCCDAKMDNYLRRNFEYVSQNVNSSKSLAYAKEITCLECHPYAAHIFDAESGSDVNARFRKSHIRFPGLCKEMCQEMFNNHKQVLLNLFRSKEFVKFVNYTNMTEFCRWAMIGDVNYCYPALNNLNISTQRIKKEFQHKLCVDPVRGPLFANALVAVHSNDQSHRLFIGEQRGLVYVILPNGTKVDKPFLNITHQVINSGVPWDERGLLGLTFHPRFKENGRFFVFYSTAAHSVNKEDYR